MSKIIDTFLSRTRRNIKLFAGVGAVIGFLITTTKIFAVHNGGGEKQYLIQYMAYPALIFLLLGFVAMIIGAALGIILSIDTDNLGCLEVIPQTSIPKTIKILLLAYVVLLLVATLMAFYLISSNFILLVSGHIYIILASI